jgi:hypothetical protein
MAFTKSPERQYPLTAVVELDYTDLPSGEAVEVIDLPPGAMVIDGFAQILVQDNAGTSSVFDVGDADDDDRYVTDLDLKSGQVGSFELFSANGLAREYTGGGVIEVKRTAVGTASTAGRVRVVVTYIVNGRANEAQAG